jgi:hypothetical protein
LCPLERGKKGGNNDIQQQARAAEVAVQDTRQGFEALQTPADVAKRAGKRDGTESPHTPQRMPRSKKIDDKETPQRS